MEIDTPIAKRARLADDCQESPHTTKLAKLAKDLAVTWYENRWANDDNTSTEEYPRYIHAKDKEIEVWDWNNIPVCLRSLYPGISDTQIFGFLISDLVYMLDDEDWHPNIRRTLEIGVGLSSGWLQAIYLMDRDMRRREEELDRWDKMGRMVLNPCF